jgi:hypothetical protein
LASISPDHQDVAAIDYADWARAAQGKRRDGVCDGSVANRRQIAAVVEIDVVLVANVDRRITAPGCSKAGLLNRSSVFVQRAILIVLKTAAVPVARQPQSEK